VKIRAQPNVPNEVSYAGDVKGEAISIFISEEDADSPNTWLLKVFVHVAQGEFLLGFVTTNTAATDGAAARAVAFASCPGAKGWKVIALIASAGSASNETFDAELTIQAGLCCGGGLPAGVFVPPQPPGSGGESPT
jgi:hypothetical protein